jgi:hypothetical protein
VIVDLEGATLDRPTQRITRAQWAIGACLAVAIALAGRDGLGPRALALPADVANVELSVFPDRLANDTVQIVGDTVNVRGTTGLAWGEGRVTVYWTERGNAYRLTSSRLSVIELLRIAASLR